jgi:hypothetical protein
MVYHYYFFDQKETTVRIQKIFIVRTKQFMFDIRIQFSEAAQDVINLTDKTRKSIENIIIIIGQIHIYNMTKVRI